MKSLFSVLAVTLVLVTGVAAVQDDISSPTLRITWEEFKKLHDKHDAVIVDVRAAQAFEQGHIPGSRSIPYDEVGKHVEELKALKKPIVLYCA
jgi:rhodanese-related sulfurtransferase